MKSSYQIKYSVNFKISLILSELLIISLFVLFPEITSEENEKIYLDEITEIPGTPPTVQNFNSLHKKPAVPKIIFDNLIEEDKILDDVISESNSEGEYFSDKKEDGLNPNALSHDLTPRQIVEVLPEQSEDKIEGTLIIKLKIDANGKVAGHQLIRTDINCTDCIDKIINAVYQSLWEPATINGKLSEFWIEKTYLFN